jgi:hypothetical protein
MKPNRICVPNLERGYHISKGNECTPQIFDAFPKSSHSSVTACLAHSTDHHWELSVADVADGLQLYFPQWPQSEVALHKTFALLFGWRQLALCAWNIQ